MLFVLSAAVRFHARPAAECAARSTPRLNHKAKQLAAELRRLEAKDIKKQLHVNDALAKQYEKHLEDFDKSKPLPACCLYDSPLYNTLNAPGFDHEDADWANSHVRVFSGLYGLLRPFDEIQPLSLPVTLGTKLKTTKGNFLRDYWRDPVNRELDDALRGMPMPVMVNCGVEAEEGVFDFEQLPEGTSMTTINFKIPDKGTAAAAMGEFVHWALATRCQTVEELLAFKGLVDDDDDGTFRLSPKAAEKDTIVFEERVGERIDGNWNKRIADSGLSKKAFIKENLSGKNKYKRTEMNKAMAKSEKSARKKHAVY